LSLKLAGHIVNSDGHILGGVGMATAGAATMEAENVPLMNREVS
jgi:hypothetical protein